MKAHQEMKMFDGHKVILFTDAELGIESVQPTDTAPIDLALCNQHQTTFVAICLSCDEMLCQHCAVEHRDHRMAALNDATAEHYQSKIRELVEQVKTKVSLDLNDQ